MSIFAESHGWSISRAVREVLKEFIKRPEIKKIAQKTARTKKIKFPFADMVGIIKGGPDLASGVDEIYDEV